jgi:hypothetical protein
VKKICIPCGLILLLILAVQGCKKEGYNPDRFFTREQQTSLIKQSVYYSTKLPPGATHETKFNSEFDSYYDIATSEYDMRACHRDRDSAYFFLMTRKARSIWPAREAIGGKFSIDHKQKLLTYEEIFRTWKMTEDTLNVRAFELFELMLEGKDLTPFQAKYKGDRYIEFPDDNFYFDKATTRWRNKALDSLNHN